MWHVPDPYPIYLHRTGSRQQAVCAMSDLFCKSQSRFIQHRPLPQPQPHCPLKPAHLSSRWTPRPFSGRYKRINMMRFRFRCAAQYRTMAPARNPTKTLFGGVVFGELLLVYINVLDGGWLGLSQLFDMVQPDVLVWQITSRTAAV